MKGEVTTPKKVQQAGKPWLKSSFNAEEGRVSLVNPTQRCYFQFQVSQISCNGRGEIDTRDDARPVGA